MITCSVNGDLLCDTPTDPKLTSKVNSICQYSGGGNDQWGDAWAPSIENYMSYAGDCRGNGNGFTDQQIAVMWSTLQTILIYTNKIDVNKVVIGNVVVNAKELIVAGFNTLQVGGNGSTYSALSGSKSINIARNSVDLQTGVDIEHGANYEAYTVPNFDCVFPLSYDIQISRVEIPTAISTEKVLKLGNKVYYLNEYGLVNKIVKLERNERKIDSIEFAYSLFPNPTTSKFTFSKPHEEPVSLVLYNATGKAVYQKEEVTALTTEIDISNAVAGIYILKISQTGEKPKYLKLVVE